MDSKLKLNKEKNSSVGVNGKLTSSQILEKNKQQQQKSTLKSSSSSSSDHGGTKSKLLRSQATPLNSNLSNNPQGGKRNSKINDIVNSNRRSNLTSNSNHDNIRSIENTVNTLPSSRSKDHNSRKLNTDYETNKSKNYAEYHQEYKTRNSNLDDVKFSNQSTSGQGLQPRQRDFNTNIDKISSKDDAANNTGVLTAAQKALEQRNLVPKMGQINFPPLRAPQSIVNVRHPFVTEAKITQNDMGLGNVSKKSTVNITSSLQNDLEHGRQTYHGYSSSPITNIQNVQSLGNITNLAQYPRADTFPQQTLASLLFSESTQYPQSTSYANQQVGQINQYQAYDPGSFTPTPVNVNSVLPQFSAESPQLSYPQFDNPPQFVQPNHYATADLANGQFQYQAAAVGQIPDSSLYLQSLQSSLTVADQYAAPNYAQAVRTELIPRLRRPPRFNK